MDQVAIGSKQGCGDDSFRQCMFLLSKNIYQSIQLARSYRLAISSRFSTKAHINTHKSRIVWTGNLGKCTADYLSYHRTWEIDMPGKSKVHCSNDPLIGGDLHKLNPEELLISALAGCHLLWYLHYASDAGIVVIKYEDSPAAKGEVSASGKGKFIQAVLRPHVTVKRGANLMVAERIHEKIHEVCFIARSINFPIKIEPRFSILD